MSGLRIADRVVAGILALVLLVGGLLVAIEIGLQAAGLEDPWVLPWDSWYEEGTETIWSDTAVRVVCVGLVVVAVLLVALQVARRRPSALPIRRADDAVDMDLDRRSVENWLEARLARVDGVGAVKVRARRRSVRVRAESVSRETAPIERRLDEAATKELADLDLEQSPSVDVRVRSRSAA